METVGREIVTKANVETAEIIQLLNQAFCDEWLSYYQYWTGAGVLRGKKPLALRMELEKHANEELEHAYQLARRIVELEGTPVATPQECHRRCIGGYKQPQNREAVYVMEQNLRRERYEIETYNKLLNYVFNKDCTTAYIVRQILREEIQHEQKLEDLVKSYTSQSVPCKRKKK